MSEYSPEKARLITAKQEVKAARSELRLEKKREKQAKNLAKHAIRKANKAKVGELIKPKLTRRFNPLRGWPAGDGSVDVHNKANAILEEQGLFVRPITLQSYNPAPDDPTFRHRSRLESISEGKKQKKLKKVEVIKT